MDSLDFNIPKAWAQLDQSQLRFIFRMIADNLFSMEEIKLLACLRFSGCRLIEACPDGSAVIVYRKQLYLLSPEECYGLVSSLDWLADLPSVPVRLIKVCGRYACMQTLNDISFESFIAADNWFQGYLATRRPDCLRSLAKILYRGRALRPFRPSSAELTNVFYWFASFKMWAARRWPHFFIPVNSNSDPLNRPPKLPSPESLRNAVDAQIRALTKGDISKEAYILKMKAHRALTELDAIARESEEIKAKLKK